MRRVSTSCWGWRPPIAVVWRGWELWSVAYLPLPQTSPGLILAVVGVGLLLYGAGTGMGTRRPL